MMEAGSKIQKDGLVKMYREFYENPKIGGICGYQEVEISNNMDEFEKIED